MLKGRASQDLDIDQGMVPGCARPMGPLALADPIGLDTVAASLYEEFKEPLNSSPPLLARVVDAARPAGASTTAPPDLPPRTSGAARADVSRRPDTTRQPPKYM